MTADALAELRAAWVAAEAARRDARWACVDADAAYGSAAAAYGSAAARQADRVAALARALRWASVPLVDWWDGGRWVVAAPALAWQASVKPGGSTRVTWGTYRPGYVWRRLDLFGDPVDVAGVVAATLSAAHEAAP